MPPPSSRLAFIVLTPPGDDRLPVLADLLARQGLPPGEHEILVAAHGPEIGVSRADALALAVESAASPRLWVLDIADRPPVNAAAVLLARMGQDRLDLLAFGMRRVSALRSGRLRFALPGTLPPAPIMEGPALLSRHDFRPELACVVADTALWREGRLSLPVGHDPVLDRAAMPQLALRAARASHLPAELVDRSRLEAGPDPEDAVAAALHLRGQVESLKAAGNPSANLALRLLRRAELVAIDTLRGLILSGASASELSRARERFLEAGALPLRHLGRPEATVGVGIWSLLATSRRLSSLASAACRLMGGR